MIHARSMLVLSTLFLAPFGFAPSAVRAPLASSRVSAVPAVNVESICAITAKKARDSKIKELHADYLLHLGTCLNLTDQGERTECLAEAGDELDEGLQLAQDQYIERLDLCGDLGPGAYDPEIEPEDFVAGVDNPYFPLMPGSVRTYHSDTADGLEEQVVTVTNQTKTVLGVECVVVHDTVTLEGVLIEDTLDYFAQDEDGNVWYFGESSQSFEDGELVSLHGSWLAGRDGAKPGVIMQAVRHVGDVYRQEFSLDVAEDAAEIASLNATADVPFGHFTHCVKTEDFTPLEPDAEERKFYAAGVGVVLEVDPSTGERLELVSVVP